MVWSFALRSDDAKQDSVVYGTKFGVVSLAEGPRTTASIQSIASAFIIRVLRDYNTGEKPTVMLYTYYINRHAGTPDKSKKTKTFLVCVFSSYSFWTSSSYKIKWVYKNICTYYAVCSL